MPDLRVLRIPFSANAERVALAAGHKGLELDWVDVDPSDRGPVRDLSGQDLVPVAVDPDDGRAICGSVPILDLIESRWPEPPLRAPDPGAAALENVFCRRFDDVWKGPPNRLAELLGPVGFDPGRLTANQRRAVDDDTARMRTWLDRFEARLDGQDHLGGSAFGICDVIALPFLRLGIRPLADGDTDPLHRVLRRHGAFNAESHPRLAAWVERADLRPRA